MSQPLEEQVSCNVLTPTYAVNSQPDLNLSSDQIIKLVDSTPFAEQSKWSLRFLRNAPIFPTAPLPPHPDAALKDAVNLSAQDKISLKSPYPYTRATVNIDVLNYSAEDMNVLKGFCYEQPTCLIKNMCSNCSIDLSLFSSKSLIEVDPKHPIEVRRQMPQSTLSNIDSVTGQQKWYCPSSAVRSTIEDCAKYQAFLYKSANKNNYRGMKALVSSTGDKKIRFGTNGDLSDKVKWSQQLRQLKKLPDFLRVDGYENFLRYVDYNILGMNTVQLYLKVPGCRTPGHQENLNMVSVNINTGPGDCEWFCVAFEYWGDIFRLCQENAVNYLSGSWWPNVDDLARLHIPLHRFLQRPGDIVWINAGTVHWVQAVGFTNNVAWNVAPVTTRQYQLSLERYEFNRLQRYKSIVPMVHLSWELAEFLHFTQNSNYNELFLLIRHTLLVSLIRFRQLRNLVDQLQLRTGFYGMRPHEVVKFCENCEEDLFGYFFSRMTPEKTYLTYCCACARELDSTMQSFEVLIEFKWEALAKIYDDFVWPLPPRLDKDESDNDEEDTGSINTTPMTP